MEPQSQRNVKRGRTIDTMIKPFAFPILLLAGLGCGSGAPAGSGEPAPLNRPSTAHPVTFSLDRTTALPLLTILMTPEEVARVKAVYAAFAVECGPPVNGVPLTMRGPKGSLEIPWRIYLRNFAAPYPVRLIGTTLGSKREVIYEELLR